MRQVAGWTLWIGHSGDLRDPERLHAAGIAAVVELADNEAMPNLPRDLIRCRFPLADGGDNPPWLLRLAADAVASLLRAEVTVLVACSGGMSRSVCIASAGLAVARGIALSHALAVVTATGPVDVAPRLWGQVQAALAS